MISDHRTNFINAEGGFKDYVEAWNKERIEGHLVEQEIGGSSSHHQHFTLEVCGSDSSEVTGKQCMQCSGTDNL